MRSALASLLRRETRSGAADPVLAAVAVGLVGFGVVMVYGASVIEGVGIEGGGPQFFLRRQAVYALLALGVMGFVSTVDYRKIRHFTYPILGAAVAGLVLVLVVGVVAGGARRWLDIGPVNIQPSEAAKLALVLWLGHSLAKKGELVKTFNLGMLPHLVMAGLLILLCIKQPDFGGAVVLAMLTLTLLFVAGARFWLLALTGLVGACGAVVAIRLKDYRWERIQAWLHMNEHRQDLAYQPFQSVMSFGSGEATGVGLGHGYQVLYLPEAHTDFVSAIVGEELGFLGVMALAAAYLTIVARGVRAALRSDDDYGAYVAVGISVLFGIQSLFNLAVAMSLLPTKGLTLPFVSYGGSSLLVSAAAMGVLLNISRPRTALHNERVGVTGPPPEASAVLVTEAEYAPGADPAEEGA